MQIFYDFMHPDARWEQFRVRQCPPPVACASLRRLLSCYLGLQQRYWAEGLFKHAT